MWAVRTSSQSLDLVDENASDVMAGNFKFMTGTERDDAFFVSAPVSYVNAIPQNLRFEIYLETTQSFWNPGQWTYIVNSDLGKR